MSNYCTPGEILEIVRLKGVEKANNTAARLLTLGIMAGIYVALGFLAYVRVTAIMPKEMGSLATFVGACVFPVGLMGVLIGGGELITGNMLVVSVAWYSKSVTGAKLAYNWVLVTLGNLIGAIAAAYFLAHFTGLSEGAFLQKTLAIAADKVNQPFWPALVSGIGCNIFVCLAVWLSFSAKDITGKLIAIWFPVMAFVTLGFQHVVANMFIIPAAIFSGEAGYGWGAFVGNCIPVYIGNVIGGAVVIGLTYYLAYSKSQKTANKEAAKV